MTEEDKKLLTTFEARLRQLLFAYEQQKEKIAGLEQTIKDKDWALEKADHNYKLLQSQYATLKAAKIVSIADDDARDTKKRLSKLVREVDKCIALLND